MKLEMRIPDMDRADYERVLNGIVLGTMLDIRGLCGRFLQQAETEAIAKQFCQ